MASNLQSRRNHPMYMDGIKIFAENENRYSN